MANIKSKDMRSPEAVATARRLQRFNSVNKALLSDLGGDPSKAQAILAHNAASLAMVVEERVDALIDGGDVNVGELSTLMNTLRRQLETLGIDRKPRDITSLARYLEDKRLPTINGAAQ
jgi:hypothetical protein